MSITAPLMNETSPLTSLTVSGEPWFARPSDILNDPALDAERKRAILASWLSDRYAVPDAPRWRQLENGAFVDSYEVRDALNKLDGANNAPAEKDEGAAPTRTGRDRRRFLRRGRVIRPLLRRKRRDDDDDPPPRPVGFGRPPASAIFSGTGRMPERAFAA